MTRVYVMRVWVSERLPRAEYSRLARRLLAEAVKREYSLDVNGWDEIKGKNGKPFLDGAPFVFNLSHSGEYVVCALSDADVGVDIEKIRPISDGVMRRFAGEAGRDDRENTRLWTRYEAVGKFLGCGIPYEKPTSAYFIKEYFDLDGYAVTVCAENDGFAESLMVLDI